MHKRQVLSLSWQLLVHAAFISTTKPREPQPEYALARRGSALVVYCGVARPSIPPLAGARVLAR
jgi:hypothetical protein